MTKLQPCRFCGETDKLCLDEGVWETQWAIDADGRVIRDANGQPTEDADPYRDGHHIDQVNCQTCDTMTSLRMWNSTPAFVAVMLASIREADAEYDDNGVWQGRGQAVAA